MIGGDFSSEENKNSVINHELDEAASLGRFPDRAAAGLCCDRREHPRVHVALRLVARSARCRYLARRFRRRRQPLERDPRGRSVARSG